jgi:hypothetical protein
VVFLFSFAWSQTVYIALFSVPSPEPLKRQRRNIYGVQITYRKGRRIKEHQPEVRAPALSYFSTRLFTRWLAAT